MYVITVPQLTSRTNGRQANSHGNTVDYAFARHSSLRIQYTITNDVTVFTLGF